MPKCTWLCQRYSQAQGSGDASAPGAALEGRAYSLGCGISWLGCVSRWDQLPVLVRESLTCSEEVGVPGLLGELIEVIHVTLNLPQVLLTAFVLNHGTARVYTYHFRGMPFQMEFDCFIYLPS